MAAASPPKPGFGIKLQDVTLLAVALVSFPKGFLLFCRVLFVELVGTCSVNKSKVLSSCTSRSGAVDVISSSVFLPLLSFIAIGMSTKYLVSIWF